MLNQRLKSVRRRIQAAAQRCGRPPTSVTLIAVTKGVGLERMREAIALGLSDIGENRVQEARAKQSALGSRLEARGTGLQPPASSLQPVRWHLIGHLQRNKAKDAVELFEMIHSVDSFPLIQELERTAGRRLQAAGDSPTRPIQVLIQANVSGEKTKFGCTLEEVPEMARAVNQCANLKLAGLMTIAPLCQDPEEARPSFRRLRQLRDELLEAGILQPAACSLSMGMSQDFEVAIEEGADFVRIGTAIFGTGDRRPETGDPS